MVGNNPSTLVDPVMVVLDRINRETSQFLYTAPDGEIVYDPFALAQLVTEILTEHTTALRAERDALARECERREADILDVIGERDTAEARLAQVAELNKVVEARPGGGW